MSPALRISIGVNLLLATAVVVLLWRERPAGRPSASPAASFAAPAVAAESGARSEPLERNVETMTDGALSRAAVMQLERAGLSRDVVGSALLEQFNQRWDRRLIELEKRHAPRRLSQRDYIEFGRLRDAERVRELKEALGEEGYRAWDKERTLRQLNGTGAAMTDEEAEQAYRLQKEFEETHKELEMAMEDGIADPADGSALQARAQEALNRDLGNLFGQQRLDEMRGLSDPSAEVRWRYGELNPTPEQTSAVITIEDDYLAREAALARRINENPTAGAAVEVATELKALNDARDEQLRGTFGAEAYERIKRQNDPTYQTLQNYADAWALSAPQLETVYSALSGLRDQTELSRAAGAMREAAGQPVNWREINAAIEQTRSQAEAGLRSVVGDETLRRLKQNGLLSFP